MSGGGLSKLGTALIIVLVISLVAIVAQFFYAWWRRRQINTDQLSMYDSSSESTFSYYELLYFFCIRHHSSIESNSVTATSTNDDRNSNRRSDVEIVDIELLKVQGIFAPPRFLFTIKEEDREDLESTADKSIFFRDKEANKINDDSKIRKVSLEECFTEADESAVAVEIDVDGGRDTTPFSTPCASPLYFTPSASPVHEGVNCRSKEEGMISYERITASLKRSEV